MYGWLNDSYSGKERYQNHILEIGFRKGREAVNQSQELQLYNVISIEDTDSPQGKFFFTVFLQLHSAWQNAGAKEGTDFKVNTDVVILEQFVIVSFLEDLTALEQEETFHLKLRPKSPKSSPAGVNVLFCDTIEMTIVDTGCKLCDGSLLNFSLSVLHTLTKRYQKVFLDI